MVKITHSCLFLERNYLVLGCYHTRLFCTKMKQQCLHFYKQIDKHIYIKINRNFMCRSHLCCPSKKKKRYFLLHFTFTSEVGSDLAAEICKRAGTNPGGLRKSLVWLTVQRARGSWQSFHLSQPCASRWGWAVCMKMCQGEERAEQRRGAQQGQNGRQKFSIGVNIHQHTKPYEEMVL